MTLLSEYLDAGTLLIINGLIALLSVLALVFAALRIANPETAAARCSWRLAMR
jgi:hypothetical protein